jgi:hypothetical protein
MIMTHLGVSVEEHEEHVISILASLFKIFMILTHLGSVADPDPGSRISDLGSRIPDPKAIFLRA